jgi:hypothetical protein
MPRSENPGVSGSIPSLPTIHFNQFRTPADVRPTCFVSELCQIRDHSSAFQRRSDAFAEAKISERRTISGKDSAV